MLALVLTTSCYNAQIAITKINGPPTALSDSEVQRAVDTVQRAVERVGMVVDKYRQPIVRNLVAGEYIYLDIFKLGPGGRGGYLDVRPAIEKQTGEFVVLIETLFHTEEDREVEEAIIAALRKEFPRSEVRSEQIPIF